MGLEDQICSPSWRNTGGARRDLLLSGLLSSSNGLSASHWSQHGSPAGPASIQVLITVSSALTWDPPESLTRSSSRPSQEPRVSPGRCDVHSSRLRCRSGLIFSLLLGSGHKWTKALASLPPQRKETLPRPTARPFPKSFLETGSSGRGGGTFLIPRNVLGTWMPRPRSLLHPLIAVCVRPPFSALSFEVGAFSGAALYSRCALPFPGCSEKLPL